MLTFEYATWYEDYMKLIDYIRSENMNPSQWAKSVGISQPIITRYLKDKRGLSLKTALKIQRVTGGMVRVDELLNDGATKSPLPDS
jgi:predicted transcriptional regulator